jgi:MFS transporter, DHA1 family, tetracycline resistance protein
LNPGLGADIERPSSGPPVASGTRAPAMGFILVTVLIDMMAIGLIVPVLPILVGKFVSTPAEQAFWFGAVMFALGITSFLSSPILGALSDRYGRRPILLLGCTGLALNLFVTAWATALWMLVAIRVVGGAMQANVAVCNAYVADITPPQDRARRFGLLGAMFGIGFILGPVLGGLLGAINIHLPFYVAGGLALLNAAWGYFVLPESLPPERRRTVDWRRLNPFSALKTLAQLKGAGLLVLVLALVSYAQFTLYTTWVLYNTFKFGFSTSDNGWSLFTVGVVSALVQGLLLGKLLKRYTPAQVALVGMASGALAYLGWGLATAGWMMFAIIMMNWLGNAVPATMNSIISSAAPPEQQGQTMGSVSALSNLMSALAPVLGAPLLAFVSHYPPGDWRIGTPFYFCAALQAIALMLAITHFRRRARLAQQQTAPLSPAP